MIFLFRIRHSSGRPLVRGVRSGSKLPEEENSSDRSSVSSQDSSSTATPVNKKVQYCSMRSGSKLPEEENSSDRSSVSSQDSSSTATPVNKKVEELFS